jgi:AcrR family transcriptional regulator
MTDTSNPKREQILKAGKDLFWKFGFRRVTVEEICREAGVSKMTYYKHFPNKLELATAILDEVFDESIAKVRALHHEHESPEKTLRKIIQLKSEGTRGISEEFIKDLYTNPEEDLKSYIEEKTRSLMAEIIKVYEFGKEDGWVRKDLNIPFFMLYIQKTFGIFSEDEMLSFFDTPQEMIMELTNLFVYGISPHK